MITNSDRRITLQGDGVNASWPFGFAVFSAADLKVIRKQTDGTEQVLNYNVPGGYTVSLQAVGGTVTYPADAHGTYVESTESITIVRAMDYKQSLDLTNAGSFRAEVVEAALDKLAMTILELREEVDRALRYPVSSDGLSPVLPAPSPGQTIAWNQAGTALENVDVVNPDNYFTALDAQYHVSEEATAAGGELTFVLTKQPGSAAAVDLYINGVHQPPSAYSVDDVTLTYSEALTTGDHVEVRYRRFGSLKINNVEQVLDASITSTKILNSAVTHAKIAGINRVTRNVGPSSAHYSGATQSGYANLIWDVAHGMKVNSGDVELIYAKIVSLRLEAQINTDGYLAGEQILLFPGYTLHGIDPTVTTNWRGFSVEGFTASIARFRIAAGGLSVTTGKADDANVGKFFTPDPANWRLYATILGTPA